MISNFFQIFAVLKISFFLFLMNLKIYLKKFINFMEIKIGTFQLKRTLLLIDLKNFTKNSLYKILYLVIIILSHSFIGFITFYGCKVFTSYTMIPISNQIFWSIVIGFCITLSLITSAIFSIFFSINLFIIISQYSMTKSKN